MCCGDSTPIVKSHTTLVFHYDNFLTLQKEMLCSETYHRNLKDNYMECTDARWCAGKYRLAGRKCLGEGCGKGFVPMTKGMDKERDSSPTQRSHGHYCRNL